MARTREFDPDRALEAAMSLFWRTGYAGASLRDLVAHTGVARAGLYGTFGGKRQLFEKALDLYDATMGTALLAALEAPDSGRAEIDRFFRRLLDAIRKGRFADGCLMCNTAVEWAGAPGAVSDRLDAYRKRMTAAFEGAVERARHKGEIKAGLGAAAAADHLTVAYVGVAHLARAKAAPDRIDRAVALALSVLD